jgi:hypothetical protein
MISNLISMAIYGTGLIVWLGAAIAGKSIKIMPIPSHKIINESGLDVDKLVKVIHW